ncbi:NUDIX domain-containing protein, partial [Escherichia coli]|nr:NUDIX domain-containing protein [Escherichia coli]
MEDCVEREGHEGTGIHGKNGRYFGSQPWAFPSSMMMAFLADYDSGQLTPDYPALSDAQWFGVKEMPPVAP